MASTARLDELKKKFEENPRRYFAPLANEHRKSGDLEQAISICRAHLPQQPGHISGHIVLAQALFEAGSHDESREIFHTALGLDPENLIALRYLGDIARQAGDVPTARSWYHRVLEVDPRNEEIVQLVRDLDAPPTEPGAASAVATEAELPSSAAEPVPSETSGGATDHAPNVSEGAAPVTANESRFAPLEAEEIDLDASDFSVPHEAHQATSHEHAAADAEALDLHAAWNPDSPTVELPMLDAPEIDPFAMPHEASAEALLDTDAPASHEDVFATDLASLASDETQPLEIPSSDDAGWFPSESAEDVPQAEAATPIEEQSVEFEEGDFYLEPAPPEPAQSSAAPDEVTAAAEPEPSYAGSHEAESIELHDEPAAFVPVVSEPAAIDAFEQAQPDAAVEDAPQAVVDDSIESVAETPEPIAAGDAVGETVTAEWPSAPEPEAPRETAAPESDLGLEVMEFVPPTSEPASAPVASASDVDPMMGRSLEPAPAESTPAAFVTETMAELYLQQGFRNEALAVYRELLARNPNDTSLRERIQQIESGSMSSLGMATLSEDVVESALRRQAGRPSRSVRSFFASLAGRRAPYRPPVEDAAAETDAPSAESVGLEMSAPAAEAPSAASDESSGMTPMMSAAEALGSFDPFEDVTDPGGDAVTEAPSSPMDASPNGTAETTSYAPEGIPSGGSLEALFPNTPVTPRTEAAAQTLATAFGRSEPQGRPTRAATSELSLDHVFRGAPDGAPAPDGGFSFDQFFSDARAAANDVAATPTSAAERELDGAGDANDIEQFTAWLEGLKKK